MTEEEKRAYQKSWQDYLKRSENMSTWTPHISDEELAEREKMIERGEIPF